MSVSCTSLALRLAQHVRLLQLSPALCHKCVAFASTSATTGSSPFECFDRTVKRRQRDRVASDPDCKTYQYVKKEAAYWIADRVYDCTDKFDVAADIGCGFGWIAPDVYKENVGVLLQTELSPVTLAQSASSDEVPTAKIASDEEYVPFRGGSLDLLLSSLSLHWVNNLPLFFLQAFHCLRPDGALIANMLGGNSLYELRCSLQLAEAERLGGVKQHVSPFVEPQDVAALMSRAGFSMLTLDLDKIVVRYPDMLSLMYDLQGMAENNASFARASHIDRDVLLAAEAIYQEMYGEEDEEHGASIPATFQIVNLIGWKPGPKMPKAAKRGSQTRSFAQLGDTVGVQETENKS